MSPSESPERPPRGADAPQNLSRRRWIVRGAALGVAALGGAVALARGGGYELDAPPSRPLRFLSVPELVLVRQLARRILAPDAPNAPGPDELGVAEHVDEVLAAMSPGVQRDLRRLLAFVEQLAPVASGHARRFTRLAPAEQDEVLRALETSRSGLLRAGFDGLKGLVMMGYWRHPRAWALVGYDGPQVGRPAGAAP